MYFNNISRIHTINVKNEGEYMKDTVAPPKYYIKNPCNDNKSYVTLEFFSWNWNTINFQVSVWYIISCTSSIFIRHQSKGGLERIQSSFFVGQLKKWRSLKHGLQILGAVLAHLPFWQHLFLFIFPGLLHRWGKFANM